MDKKLKFLFDHNKDEYIEVLKIRYKEEYHKWMYDSIKTSVTTPAPSSEELEKLLEHKELQIFITECFIEYMENNK